MADTTIVPEQAAPATQAAPTAAALAAQAKETLGEAKEKVAEAKEKVGEFADKAGEAISDAASRASDALSDAAQTAITRIRNNATIPSERGHTQIAAEVVEKVSGIAAREVPGVFDLGGDVARVVSQVREFLHIGEESKAQGVGVRLEGRQAQISVTLVIEYGFVVSSVTDKVREKVISSVEALLELDVVAVDILVDDVHIGSGVKLDDDVARAAEFDSSTKGVVVGKK